MWLLIVEWLLLAVVLGVATGVIAVGIWAVGF